MNANAPLNVLAADANPATSLEQRYGAAMPSLGAAPNAVIESLLGHRTVRAFSDSPLPEGTLEWQGRIAERTHEIGRAHV